MAGILSAATYFRDKNDLAAGFQFDVIGVLEYLAIDRDGHAFLDLRSQPRVFLFQFSDQLPERGCFYIELGLATGKLMARPARSNYDFRQTNSFSSGIERRADNRR
jgi:hypothetical protein